MVVSRAQYGFQGNKLSCLFSWIVNVGYEGVDFAIAALAAYSLFNFWGWHVNTFWKAVILGVIIVVSFAIGLYGHATIFLFQKIFAWALGVASVFFAIFMIGHVKFSYHPSPRAARQRAAGVGPYRDQRRAQRPAVVPDRVGLLALPACERVGQEGGLVHVHRRLHPGRRAHDHRHPGRHRGRPDRLHHVDPRCRARLVLPDLPAHRRRSGSSATASCRCTRPASPFRRLACRWPGRGRCGSTLSSAPRSRSTGC